jgi:arsenate reductase
MIEVYTYKNCSTCRKAVKWLDAASVRYVEFPIREKPPRLDRLQRMLGFYGNNLKALFNTSGLDYRRLGLSQKLPGMELDVALQLLASNGNLVKRPFLIGPNFGKVGFKEAEWARLPFQPPTQRGEAAVQS